MTERFAADSPDELLAYALDVVARNPASAEARRTLGMALCIAQRWREAREQLLWALRQPDTTGIARAIVLNNIAWADVMLNDPTLLDEADRCSAEAFAELAGVPAVLNTRGLVLALRGDTAGAISLLTQALGELPRKTKGDRVSDRVDKRVAGARPCATRRHIQRAQASDRGRAARAPRGGGGARPRRHRARGFGAREFAIAGRTARKRSAGRDLNPRYTALQAAPFGHSGTDARVDVAVR